MEAAHIGHYELGKTIGTGGFARVVVATHKITGLKVAIKILNRRKMKNKNMIEKVKREIDILKTINHPNIIKLYQVIHTTNDIYLVMELAEGGDFYDYLQDNEVSEEEAKEFFRQIIGGVAYAHRNLITHRDLKPENILIDYRKRIKIIDFGLSNRMADGKSLKTNCGSPNYAAPEVVGERLYEGTTVDVWSCGVILFAMLTESLPFEAETASLLYRKIEAGDYKIQSKVNPIATDLIRRMLQVDPYARIRVSDIINHPWLRDKVPLYAKIFVGYSSVEAGEFTLEESVYKEVKNMVVGEGQDINDQLQIRAIKKRQNQSFAITYEILKDHRQKAIPNQDTQKPRENFNNSILNEIENSVKTQKAIAQKQFVFGKSFTIPMKKLKMSVIQGMNYHGIHFENEHPYIFNCKYYPLTFSSLRDRKTHSAVSTTCHSDPELSEQQQKFTKREVDFSIHIYSGSSSPSQNVLDLHLISAHPMVFFGTAHKLLTYLDTHH